MFRKRHFSECGSTNDEAAKWARDSRDPAPHGAVVTADAQTAGRGRLGRKWHSPAEDNLYFSVVLRPDLIPAKVPPITLCAGLAVCEVVNALGVPASVKWPNDVFVDNNKLAGVLTEMSTQGNSVEAVIVGVGLNVNAREFPAPLQATSLFLETEKSMDPTVLLDALLDAIVLWTDRYCEGGVRALQTAFLGHSMLQGKTVRGAVRGNPVTGQVLGLGEDGSLHLRDTMGVEHNILAGEVHLINA